MISLRESQPRVVHFFARCLTLRQTLTLRINRAPAVLAFAGAVLLLRTNTAESTPPPNVLPVQVAPAEEVDTLLRKRVYTGTLVAARRSALSFETAGKIVELVADEGDRVEAGQILGRLDTRRLEALRAQSQAELVESAARLREFIAGPRTQTIAAAEAEVRNLAAQRDVAQRNLERRAQLVASRAISREEYDEMLFEFRAAEARVDVAQKTLDELIAGTRQEQIDAQQARTQALEAVVADTRHRLEDAVLRAPFAGQIVKRNLDEGTVVALGEPVFELIEAAALEAWIGAPPRAVATLTPGAAMRVEIDNEEYEAVVQSIRPELDPQTRTQNVVLRIPRDPRLVAGQVVRAAIVQPIAMRGFWTPTASLTPRRRGLWAVYVVAAGRAEPRDVEVIETDGDRSFIRGTLAPGEPVIAEGAHRIVAGQAVTIASERPAVTATTKPR